MENKQTESHSHRACIATLHRSNFLYIHKFTSFPSSLISPYIGSPCESYANHSTDSVFRNKSQSQPVSQKVERFFIRDGNIESRQRLRFTVYNTMLVGHTRWFDLARTRAYPAVFHRHCVAVLPLIIYRVSVKSANRRHRTIQHTWRAARIRPAGVCRTKPPNARSIRLIYFLYFPFKLTDRAQ